MKTIKKVSILFFLLFSLNVSVFSNNSNFKNKVITCTVNEIEVTRGDDKTAGLAWTGDFQLYSKIWIKAGRNWQPDTDDAKHTKKAPNIYMNRGVHMGNKMKHSNAVSTSTREVRVRLTLWDWDELSKDDMIDINPDRNARALDLLVNLDNGQISQLNANNRTVVVGRVGQPLTFEGQTIEEKIKVLAKITLTIDAEAIFGQFFPWRNLSGYYKCNDGGHYYVRQEGNTVVWFGEHPNGAWANVFRGIINREEGTIEGNSYDISKGRAKGQTQLSLKYNNNGVRLFKVSGRFGGTEWDKQYLPQKLPGIRQAGFSDSGNINSLDGLWRGNDGGTYYLRQAGRYVIWFGEGGHDRNGIPSFANIAIGKKTDNVIKLSWFDVPKCKFNGTGKLVLRLDNADTLTRTDNNGVFGGTSWRR